MAVLLVLITVLFISGNAVRSGLLPHVKTAFIGSGSILYSFSGTQVSETGEHQYLLETEAAYASCFSAGVELRWIPDSDAEQLQSLQVIAVETSDNICHITLEPGFQPGSVIIQNGTLQVDSPFYPALVPSAAFVSGDMVYVLQADTSTGKINDVISACKVKAAPGNGQYIPCVSGIAPGTQVLIAWDRPLTIGGKVKVVSK